MNQRGFTLLEIIVAVGVFAVLTALAYGGLNQVLNQSRATTAISQELQNLQFAFSFMQQDFGQIMLRTIRDEYGNGQAALETPVDESSLIRFSRNGWTNPAEQSRSAIQRVAYQLEDNQLQRLFWFELDRAPTSEAINMVMLDDVEEIQFRFLDSDNEWQEEWPPANLSGGSAGLPVVIEANITTNRWGTLTRLFSLIDVPNNLPAIGAPSGTNNNQNSGTNQNGNNNTNNQNPGNQNPS